jgi:subtilase family serine protease
MHSFTSAAKLLARTLLISSTLLAAFAQRPRALEHIENWAHPPRHIFLTGNGTTPSGFTPAQMRQAYGFNLIANQGAGQVIGIVDAFDDPNIEADLGVFNNQFGLPACTTANGCFKKVYAAGTPPRTDAGWAGEIALDVEWAHAIAPQAKIVLVEAATNSNSDLFTAVDVAVQNGATVVSMSWGGSEFRSEAVADSHFNVTGVTFLASSGDSGHGVEYPAASPLVVGVGGTSLALNATGGYAGEAAWNGSGGGASTVEPEPSYQTSVQQSGVRTVPDVAYDANPNTGVPIYDSIPYQGLSGWVQIGGTSMSAPQWGALIAIANSARVARGKGTLNHVLTNLYTLSADLHDIARGSNGNCGSACTAGTGYDQVTGLGSPRAALLIPALVALP